MLALILQRFEIEPTDPDYRLVISETLTLKPKGFFMRARRRSAPARSRAAPAASAAAARCPVATPGEGHGTPLLVIYGSNFGSSEAFARRIADDAATHGYVADVGPMDAYVDRLPTEGAVVVVTASYQGKPPDNARRLVEWLEGLRAGALEGISYFVLGCGDRKWARTFQLVPTRTDELLARAGATRLRPRGVLDADGDLLDDFERWLKDLWVDVETASQKGVARSLASTV